MFLSVNCKSHYPLALKAKVVDQDTGEDIKHVIWANDETGRYRQCLTDDKGQFVCNAALTSTVSKIFKGNIKLVIVDG